MRTPGFVGTEHPHSATGAEGHGREAHLAAEHELAGINQQLADLLETEPAKIVYGAGQALRDELVLCGLLGGKSVGKSTLINALAQAHVSENAAEAGRGTDRPTAYVHNAARESFEHRLHLVDPTLSIDVTLHDADAVRNAVLVDLPDFDSEFPEHLAVVRAVAPLLDRIVWVLTPRKLGDREWTAMFREVVKDPSNVHYVVNKLDELLADADALEPASKSTQPSARPAVFGQTGDTPQGGPGAGRVAEADGPVTRFWHHQLGWLQRSLERAGCSQAGERRFLVAAAFPDPDRFLNRIAQLWDDPDWSTYHRDRSVVQEIARLTTHELSRLRGRILSPTTQQEARAIKTANRGQERRINVRRIKDHYDLDGAIARVAEACDAEYLQGVLDKTFGQTYCGKVSEGIRQLLRPDTEMADELLDRRVQAWPLLRLVYWPFGWLARTIGRVRPLPSFTAPGAGDRRAAPPRIDEMFEGDGLRLDQHIDTFREQLLADHSVIAKRLGIEDELPAAADLAERVRRSGRRLLPHLESQLLDQIRQNDRRPSVLAKGGIWLIFLWFPFVQPILAGILEIFAETGSFHLARGFYRIVSAMSATHLLAGFAVVGGVYLALLAAMYTRALRTIRRQKDEHVGLPVIVTALDSLLADEIVAPLAKPFYDRLERLERLQQRLDALSINERSA